MSLHAIFLKPFQKEPYNWNGQVSPAAWTVLSHHAVQADLTPLQQAVMCVLNINPLLITTAIPPHRNPYIHVYRQQISLYIGEVVKLARMPFPNCSLSVWFFFPSVFLQSLALLQ